MSRQQKTVETLDRLKEIRANQSIEELQLKIRSLLTCESKIPAVTLCATAAGKAVGRYALFDGKARALRLDLIERTKSVETPGGIQEKGSMEK